MTMFLVASGLLIALYIYGAVKGRKEDIHAKVLTKVSTKEAKDTGGSDTGHRESSEDASNKASETT